MTKCRWIRPLVEQPQTKNVPNRIQNTGTRATSRSTRSGESSSESRDRRQTGGGEIAMLTVERQADIARPVTHENQRDHAGDHQHVNRLTPAPCASRSWSGVARSAAGTTAGRLHVACGKNPHHQAAPVVEPAHVATVTASTMAVSPVPMPTTKPHSRMSCQTVVIANEAMKPAEIRITAVTMTARTP